MMEITAIGMGLMMTSVAVAIAGLMLEATLLMLSRALRVPHLSAPLETAAINSSRVERAVYLLNPVEKELGTN